MKKIDVFFLTLLLTALDTIAIIGAAVGAKGAVLVAVALTAVLAIIGTLAAIAE